MSQGSTAQARACYFDPVNKWGAWANVPLAGYSQGPLFGLRYSTPAITAGGMVHPTQGKVDCLWLVRTTDIGQAMLRLPKQAHFQTTSCTPELCQADDYKCPQSACVPWQLFSALNALFQAGPVTAEL